MGTLGCGGAGALTNPPSVGGVAAVPSNPHLKATAVAPHHLPCVPLASLLPLTHACGSAGASGTIESVTMPPAGAAPTPARPIRIVVVAALDSKDEPQDLPLAPWA